MTDDDRRERAARHMWSSHQRGEDYANLPPELRPHDVDDAFAIQRAYHRLAEPVYGPIGGWKIATTTKVMQELMGIGHPCAGAIFERTIHHSPAKLHAADYVSLKLECELAFRLAADLPKRREPYTAAGIVDAVESVMPAFEIVDDRNAVYRETSALSLIVDNAWNRGIVLGAPAILPPVGALNALSGRLQIADRPKLGGKADGPLDALAWIANLIAERRDGLKRGMVVMTGSLIPTQPISTGESATFTVAALGETCVEVT